MVNKKLGGRLSKTAKNLNQISSLIFQENKDQYIVCFVLVRDALPIVNNL